MNFDFKNLFGQGKGKQAKMQTESPLDKIIQFANKIQFANPTIQKEFIDIFFYPNTNNNEFTRIQGKLQGPKDLYKNFQKYVKTGTLEVKAIAQDSIDDLLATFAQTNKSAQKQMDKSKEANNIQKQKNQLTKYLNDWIGNDNGKLTDLVKKGIIENIINDEKCRTVLLNLNAKKKQTAVQTLQEFLDNKNEKILITENGRQEEKTTIEGFIEFILDEQNKQKPSKRGQDKKKPPENFFDNF